MAVHPVVRTAYASLIVTRIFVSRSSRKGSKGRGVESLPGHKVVGFTLCRCTARCQLDRRPDKKTEDRDTVRAENRTPVFQHAANLLGCHDPQ
jgi:hypothetical protein